MPLGPPLVVGGKLYTILGVLPRDYRSIMHHGISPEVYLLADKDPGVADRSDDAVMDSGGTRHSRH